MYSKEKIYRDAKQILDDSKVIKPYVVIAQPRRDLNETPAQNLDGYNTHIDLRAFSHGFINIGGEKVDIARNYLMLQVMESGAKYLLFVGEDTVLPYDGFLKLHKTCEDNPNSCAVGVYYMKICPSPMIMIRDNDWVIPADVTPGQVFPIWQAGMDAMLIPVDILKRLYKEEPDNPFCCIVNNIEVDGAHIEFVGEDNYFYNRLHKMNVPVLCNTDVQCLHMDLATGKYTAHESVDLSNYITNIPITETLTERDRSYIENRWSSRLPKGSFDGEYLEIPTANDRHIDDLIKLVEDRAKIYVELGVYKGGTYLNICKKIKENRLDIKCFGVDTWKGSVHEVYGEYVYEDITNLHEEFKEFSTLIRDYTTSACKTFNDKSIDVLFIDASHQYKDVESDFNNYLPKMRDNGVVIFHDIAVTKINKCDVWKYWNNIKEKYNYEERVIDEKDEGIGIIWLGDK